MYEITCHALAVLVQKIVDNIPELEALHPRASGMQALCALHLAVDKAKCFAKQIVVGSKLYLAITSDSVLLKFKRVKDCLEQGLIGVLANFPEAYSKQIVFFLAELQGITLQSGTLYKETGDKIIYLLQREKEDPTVNALSELEVFQPVALSLGINSSRSISAEKKALRCLFERVRREEDKKKKLIVFYLLHLLHKYSKACKLAAAEDADIESSCPPSPSERGLEASSSGRESEYSSELEILSIKRRGHARRGMIRCSDHRPIPPEEFRCPISLQLMADPVIISSGQTYERVCIEKWFEEGHDTCPKTQQRLAHLDVTPNFCVKGLIMSWCERHSLPIPSPPSRPPPAICDWRSDSFSESAPLKDPIGQFEEVTQAGTEIEPIANEELTEEVQAHTNDLPPSQPDIDVVLPCTLPATKGYVHDTGMLLEKLHSTSLNLKYSAAEEIRFMTKEDSNARTLVGEAGLIPLLVGCVDTALQTGNEVAMETVCLALSNVAIDNNRNRAELVSAEVVPLIIKLLDSDVSVSAKEAAIVVLLTASCLEANKMCIAVSGVVPILLKHLDLGSPQGIKDVLATIFNLSALKCSPVVNSGLVSKLMHLLSLCDTDLSEKCLALMYTLVLTEEGRSSICKVEGCISTLVGMLDNSSTKEREHVVGILLVLCISSPAISHLVLQEGIIPSLVMLSANGSTRGKHKASKLLQHFREQRQKANVYSSATISNSLKKRCHVSFKEPPSDDKNASHERGEKQKKSRAFGFFQRSRSFVFCRCQSTA